MATEFTKGPWKVDQLVGKQARICGDNWTGLAKVYTVLKHTNPDDSCNDTGKANARLIAAAPELLEALKDAYKVLVGWHGRQEWKAGIIANAKAAIAKAEAVHE